MPRKARVGSEAWRGLAGERGLTMDDLDTSKWVQVDDKALSPDRRADFRKRKGAIEAYLNGMSAEDLKKTWGLGRANIERLVVDRCLQPHADGHLWGWRGAVPHVRVEQWTRKTRPNSGHDGGMR
jgi:hypothetical protein